MSGETRDTLGTFFDAFTSKPCNICGRKRNWQIDGQLQAVCYDCGNPRPASPPPAVTGEAMLSADEWDRFGAVARAVSDHHDFWHHGPLLRRVAKATNALRASGTADERLREAAERRRWAEEVVRVWWEAWEPKPSHRYGHDFPAFLGERFLTDFDLRDIEPRNRYSPVTDAGLRASLPSEREGQR